MTDASDGDEADRDLVADRDDGDLDEFDEDDGWGAMGLRDRLLGGPPLWLLLVAAVLLGLGLLNGIALWKEYGGNVGCVTSVFGDGSGDDGCESDRWFQLQGFLGGLSNYALAATVALVGHAWVVDRYWARQARD